MATALNRFISRLTDWCRHFFQLLHKLKDFMWTKEYDKAFKDLKMYVAHPPFPPILSRPRKEVLYSYIEVTAHAVSLVLI